MNPQPVSISQIDKNKAEAVCVSLTTHEGKAYADIRVWYWDEHSDVEELRPTRKRIRLRLDLVPKLLEALQMLGERVADPPSRTGDREESRNRARRSEMES